MNYFIRRVQISGLFEDERNNLTIDLNENVNCIYGANGSGKTTVINLIVACLLCDIKKISSLPFREIKIFVSTKGRKRAQQFLSVKKEQKAAVFSFSDEESPIRFVLGDYDVERSRTAMQKINSVREKINKSLSLIYVPLTRMQEAEVYSPEYMDDIALRRALARRDINDEEIRSITDPSRRMLADLEKEFIRKYAVAQKRINIELEDLKNRIVQKILMDEKSINEFQLARGKIEKEAERLGRHEEPSKYYERFSSANIRIPQSSIEKHFHTLDGSIQKFNKLKDLTKNLGNKVDTEHKDRAWSEFYQAWLELASLIPIYKKFQDIIDEVTASEKTKEEFLDVFSVFEKTINGFLINKKFEFSRSGEFSVSCKGREIKVFELSSGEKHVVALFGRVALSPPTSSVFIADEPELSLHLEWQRRIIPSIRNLSSGMQIIVATHSPAIIPDQESMINLDECYK